MIQLIEIESIRYLNEHRIRRGAFRGALTGMGIMTISIAIWGLGDDSGSGDYAAALGFTGLAGGLIGTGIGAMMPRYKTIADPSSLYTEEYTMIHLSISQYGLGLVYSF